MYQTTIVPIKELGFVDHTEVFVDLKQEARCDPKKNNEQHRSSDGGWRPISQKREDEENNKTV